MPPETPYAKSGDVRIAYQVSGDGPVDLVMVSGFISNVETTWKSPELSRYLLRLASPLAYLERCRDTGVLQ